jgi:hypothetical protein
MTRIATMKILLLAVISTAATSVAGHALPPSPATPAVPSGVELGVENPETAVWDQASGAWYVSNNALSGGEASIVKLVPGGEPQIVAGGLDAPQGFVIYNGEFIVADAANVTWINMANPAQRHSVNIGSSNDLDVDRSNGDVYVGSINANSIKRIRDGVVENFATISSPDGVAFSNGAVYVNTLGLGAPQSGLYRIDATTKAMTTIIEVPFGAFDGLERDGDSWLMTDFAKGQLYRVNSDGSISFLAQLAPGSAQPGLNAATRTLAVPNLALGVVVFLQV